MENFDLLGVTGASQLSSVCLSVCLSVSLSRSASMQVSTVSVCLSGALCASLSLENFPLAGHTGVLSLWLSHAQNTSSRVFRGPSESTMPTNQDEIKGFSTQHS